MTEYVEVGTTRRESGAGAALFANFMGGAPDWYKQIILAFLVINPIALMVIGPVATGWMILGQFLFTLAMALQCYPLQSGGLLAIEAVALGLTSPKTVYEEVITGLPVILLLMFMVAGVYFLRDFLFVLITRIFLSIRSNVVLAVCMCAAIAVLSAFLDALTILAILVTVGYGFYDAYSRVAVGRVANPDSEHDFHLVPEARREELEQFRAFLRSMLMHGAVGTAIGGVCTLVGEPENIIIGAAADWNFGRFFAEVAPVAVPVLIAGLITCAALERLKIFGYGIPMPPGVAAVLNRELQEQQAHWTMKDRMLVVAQAVICVGLIAGLGLHVAEVGLLGLALVVLASTMSGVTTEHQLGKAFEAGLPFTALIVVFFAIVGMIHTQHLFEPVIAWVLTLDGTSQLLMVYATNGLLSAISDNVFVAAIYIDQAKQAFTSGLITLERFEQLAVAIVMGTGIPAMATPNGQAAFLFLFTSAIGKLVGLSYGRMVWMALPYVIITSAAAALMFAFI